MTDCILFVQKKPHQAGAQTCLARLLQAQAIRAWNPVLLCSEQGWLTRECERIGVRIVIEAFPSSRSLPARLIGNRLFARRVAKRLREEGLNPTIVQANDHLEGIIGLLIAKQFGAKTSMLLRSPGTSKDDYFKYKANDYDGISAIGDELTERVKGWDTSTDIQPTHDGLLDEEFLPPKARSEHPPRRMLVLGSPLVWKGWRDVVDAIVILEAHGNNLDVAFDFTGDVPNPASNDLKIERVKNTALNFLGHSEKFRDLVRSYDLVINASRMETFGMAAIETLAAGVPLLSSRVGVIDRVQTKPEMLFPAGDAQALAKRIDTLLSDWGKMDFDLPAIQSKIRSQFHIDRAAGQLDAVYRGLVLPRQP
jgi:glycosyltransferase involved in cell wall biosynthesis